MSRPPPAVARLNRLRGIPLERGAVGEVTVAPGCLIYPVFVGEMASPRPVASMPDVHQWPVKEALERMIRWRAMGLRSFLLFGVTPDRCKNATGDYALDPDCPVNRLLTLARQTALDATLIADACFCEYTDHGHCGILTDNPAAPDPPRTRAQLARLAVAQARAGAHVVAPSAMCDGQVGAMRQALDEAGFHDTAILGYSVKYASSFYGPFREAGGCSLPASAQTSRSQTSGGRRAYQMDYRRSHQWRDELLADLSEGADAVMVKPAGHYLDIVRQARDLCDVPVAGYHVSGEYAMLHAAAQRGWLDLRAGALEVTTAIRRAGADWVVTYFAPQLVQWLAE